MPQADPNEVGGPTDMPTNLQLLIRFETNLKLNIIDKDGTPMISEDQNDEKEVHFVKFETVTDRMQLGLGIFSKLFKRIFVPQKLEFERWYITDFDDCLKGNPHIKEEEKKDWIMLFFVVWIYFILFI